MRAAFLALIALAVSCPSANAQELTEQQMGPWKALQEQTALGAKKDWAAMKRYLHPKARFWGSQLPSPVTMDAYEYFTKLFDHENEYVAGHLVPVSVVVVDDVAIINCYYHILTKNEDGSVEETVERLHNTWKKEGSQWQLLATYNTTASSPEVDDD